MAASDNSFYVAPANPLQALMLGVQGYDRGKQNAAEDLAEQALQTGDTRVALAKLIGAGDYKTAQVLAQYQSAAQGVYGTPIYGTDPATGQTVLGAIGKNGHFQKLDTGGVQINPGVKLIDTGTGTVVVDSRSGRPVGNPAQPTVPGQPQAAPQAAAQPNAPAGYVPKDVAGAAREKTYGTDVGNRQAALGQAKAALDTSLNNLDRLSTQATELLNHPGLSHITGLYGVLPNVPGYPGADAQAKLDTLKFQAGFNVLQAMRDSSKTGGALGNVSNYEDQILQNNLAELSNAQSSQQFKTALNKIITYANGAKGRLQAAYQQDYSNIPQPNPSAQPTTQTTPAPRGAPVTRQIGNKTYIQIGNQWYEQ